ncbi:predicted protein [Botrytis cinerea T4]|uniref:Uncharacterized protein n=1 Tax=Botryotinia fuckeliana (strain T4) TaxID=999810 RepID=G2XN43_BOTF4|nr:predicted protein [Botrytis cinerea T4]
MNISNIRQVCDGDNGAKRSEPLDPTFIQKQRQLSIESQHCDSRKLRGALVDQP